MSDLPTAIPKGSWILITGVAGFLASHITKQLLDRGFKVRGTVRDPSAAIWVTDEMFADANNRGDLEIVALDFVTSTASAYEAAVKGVHGVLHVASIQTFDPNPNNVITPAMNSVIALLEAALREPTVKRFVYTSSSVAAFMPNPFSDEATIVGRDSWNDVAIAAAWDSSDSPLHGAIVYMASKAKAEKALWNFATEKKPQFVVNVVSPYTLVGPILHESYTEKNIPGWINQLYNGNLDFIKNIPALYYVGVKDVAIIEVGALLDPDVKGERIQAWCTPFNWNDILGVWRKKYTERKFVNNLPNMGKINAKIDDTLPKHLLKKWGNQVGWTSMEDGFQETLDSLLAASQS